MVNEAPKTIGRENLRQCRIWSQFLGDKLSIKNYNDRRRMFRLSEILAPWTNKFIYSIRRYLTDIPIFVSMSCTAMYSVFSLLFLGMCRRIDSIDIFPWI